MNNNKTEIFKNLLEEFQKLKNLEAKHPTLQSEFNNIVNQSTLQKIAALIQKQQAKTLASKEHVVAMRGVNMQAEEMEEDNEYDKTVKNWKILSRILEAWKSKEKSKLKSLLSDVTLISTNHLKHMITSDCKSLLLIDIYTKLNSSIDDKNMQVGIIASKFTEILNAYDFSNEAFMKEWFNKEKQSNFYKNTSITVFESYLIDLAGMIKENEKTLGNFTIWKEANLNSLEKINQEGFISSQILHNKLSEFYSKTCPTLLEIYLNNIDLNETKIAAKDIKNSFYNILKSKTVEETVLKDICYNYDSIGNGLIGTFINNSIINNANYKDLEYIITNSAQAARDTLSQKKK